jgi:hypothetical protein
MSPEGQPRPTGQNLEEVRKRLLRLVRKKGCCQVSRPPERPSDWKPDEIRQEDRCALARPQAWFLIAEWLEEDCELFLVQLDKPPGKVAYAFEKLYCNQRVYVKLEIADGDRVLYGRSFHLSRSAQEPPPS